MILMTALRYVMPVKESFPVPRITSEQRVNEWPSMHIGNILFAGLSYDILRQFHLRLFEARHSAGLSSVQHVRSLFGKQDYCWDGSHRYYIWEGRTKQVRWRLFASTIGISIEVEEGCDVKGALAVLTDFKKVLANVNKPNSVLS